MPRNYDEMRAQRDLDFVFNGETYRLKVVPWKEFQLWELARNKAIGETEDEEDIGEIFTRWIGDMLEDQNGSLERWKALQESPKAPTLGELTDLVRWLTEEQSGLPTKPPSPSAAGRGRTVASSKGASS